MSTPTFFKAATRIPSILFLLGVFFIFGTFALIIDQMGMGRQPLPRLLLSVLVTGLFSASYAAAGFLLRGKAWRAFVPIFTAHLLLMGVFPNWLPDRVLPPVLDVSEVARIHQRLVWDGRGTILAIVLGYFCFVYVTITQAQRYFRARAEIDLAMEIHRVLVHPIDQKMGTQKQDTYEFCARSSPSGDVGGDLIDLVEISSTEGLQPDWVAYVADVSGHGVAPGVVMGMVKSATHMCLSSGESPLRLLTRLNDVLYPLKKPEMFATFCLLAKHGDALSVGLAGHPPILHWSARTNTVTQLECNNLPLAILPNAEFVTSEVRPESGDILALYTDGLPETENAAHEEFGVTRISQELQQHSREPLAAICQSILAGVNRHGKQVDDQSLFLIRKL